jgi:23S rRNA (pseudouridine1915-N3)-methyltransferase
MMTLLTIGKLSTKGMSLLSDHYLKQMPFLKVIELKESHIDQEGKLILKKVEPQDVVISLEIEGDMMDSISFSNMLFNQLSDQLNRLILVIGGSDGLSEDVKQRANYRLSISKMTLPHQLARIVLLEQLYRAYKIHQKHPYHK